MTPLPVQRRWFYTLLQIGAITTITLIGTLGIGIRVFAAPFVAPQAPPLPPAIQILFFFVLVAFAWFGGRAIARLLCDSKTEFTATGIQRPFWSTPSFIPWSTVQEVIFTELAILIITPTQRVKISPSVFKHPAALVARLQAYVAQSETSTIS